MVRCRTPSRESRLPRTTPPRLSWLAVLLLLASPGLQACPYSIRDSAFIGRGSVTPFQLLLPVRSADVDESELTAFRSHLARATAAWLEHSNVVTKIVDLSRDEDRSHPPEVRSALREASSRAVLVAAGDASRALVVSTVEDGSQGLPSSDSLNSTLKRVIQSPLRTGLHEALIDRWCVALFIPGSSEEANRAARRAVEAATKRIVGTKTELGKRIEGQPLLATVSFDDPHERVVSWSLGLDADTSRKNRPARLVLLAGRAESRGPTLSGSDITESNVYGRLEMLGRSCSCTTSTTWLIGTAVPFTWTDDHALAARAKLGFDPLDPAVLRSIRGEKEPPKELAGFEAFEELAYEELDVEIGEISVGEVDPEEVPAENIVPESESVADVDAVAPAEEPVVVATEESPTPPEPDEELPEESSSVGAAVVYSVLALALIAVVATVAVRRPSKD